MTTLNGLVLTVSSLAAAALLLLPGNLPQEKPVGYSDTPFLPGGKWRVHDGKRPAPRVVSPGKVGPFTQAPDDAVVLFDGGDLSRWKGRKGDPAWRVADGYMEVNGTGPIETRDHYGSVQLHIEWATPATVKGKGQGRGNSGVYLMGRYEIQVLDSFKNRTYADGQAAAMYGQYPPLVNACRGPGEWQAYDIFFEAPVFAGEKVVKPARVTVLQNGVLVQNAREFLGASTHRSLPKYRAHGKAPIRLQDHGNPVRFRNVWLREL